MIHPTSPTLARAPRHGLTALSLAALVAALAGCATNTKLDEPGKGAPVESRATTPGGTAATSTAKPTPTPQSTVATVDLAGKAGAGGAGGMAGMAEALSQRVVYFDFDSFVIKDEYKSLLDAHAKALNTSKTKHVVVEGHTDERGGREYNLALGQKRAEAVVKSLKLLGAGDRQLEAVSFGQERPLVQGSDESAWSKNRRAELKDR
jgi:peptidoglycan-associated lipoprotein